MSVKYDLYGDPTTNGMTSFYHSSSTFRKANRTLITSTRIIKLEFKINYIGLKL